MAQDFLSQAEVDALLRGVTPEEDLTYEYDFNGYFTLAEHKFCRITSYSNKLDNYLRETFVENVDYAYVCHEIAMTEEAFTMISMKFRKYNQ